MGMTDSTVDKSKRRFLIATTSAVGGLATVGVAAPFVLSLQPSERAKAMGAPVEFDIGKLEPGQLATVEWRGQVVWVMKRTPEMLSNLKKTDALVNDPESNNKSQQPDYARNQHRSLKPELMVLVGICTHLGCSPTKRTDIAPADLGPDWVGGFFCPCHGSKFDLAGRVYKGVPAPTNLRVPPYQYLSESKILIGSDQKSA
jgi:ubiquinol-cytochrome c reductase iron-sulfur subunit